MSKQTNTAVIGSFVLGGLILLVAGLLIFGGGELFSKTNTNVLFFDGSVNGLSTGAPVKFKGVRIGSVTDVHLLFDPQDLSFKIMVLIKTEPQRIKQIQVDEETTGHLEKLGGVKGIIDLLVGKGLRAQLALQSLVTGQLYVNLDFYPDRPSRIVGLEKSYVEVPTIPSNFEQFSKTIERIPLEEIADKLAACLEGIERFFNSPDSRQIPASVHTAVKDAQALLENVNARVEPISANLENTLNEARNLLANINKQVGPLAKDVSETVRETKTTVKNLDGRIATVASGLDRTLNAAHVALTKAESTLAAVEDAVGENSDLRYEFASTLKELSNTARSVRTLTDDLERHPESLIRGKK